MKNLKHILIYEAFSSKTISKTLNFLDKKVGKKQKIKFLNSIKEIKDIYDYPIDLIDDKWMYYLSKKEAYNLKSDKKVDNPYGIQYLKFWFSLEKGYLGYSGVGNRINRYNKMFNEPLTNKEIEYIISHDILPNKGKLIPVNDYYGLNHLDECIILVDGYLTSATIWIKSYDDRDYLYAIQDVAFGNSPDEKGDVRNWRKYGEYSWAMGSKQRPSKDHYKLHKYVFDESPLRVEVLDEDEEGSENPLYYNLPIDSKGKLTWWGNQVSIDNDDKIEQADFAIVLNFDEMLSSNYEKPSDKKSKRDEARVGATKLLSDDDIKKANIERYIGELLKRLGINKNEFTPNNLQKIILMTLQGEFALMSCKLGYINMISDIIPRISDLISVHNLISIHKNIEDYINDSIENYHKRLLDQYKKIYNKSLDGRNKLKVNIYNLKKYYDNKEIDLNNLIDGKDSLDDIKIILDKIFGIGTKIYNNVAKLPVDNIADLKIIYQKLKSIRLIVNQEDEFDIGGLEYMEYLYQYSNDISDVTNYFNRLIKEERIGMIEALNNIERYVDSIFK